MTGEQPYGSQQQPEENPSATPPADSATPAAEPVTRPDGDVRVAGPGMARQQQAGRQEGPPQGQWGGPAQGPGTWANPAQGPPQGPAQGRWAPPQSATPWGPRPMYGQQPYPQQPYGWGAPMPGAGGGVGRFFSGLFSRPEGPGGGEEGGERTPLLNTRQKAAAIGAAVVVALGAGAAGAVGALALTGTHTVYASPTQVRTSSDKTGSTTAAVAKAVQPSVVSISVVTQTGEDTGSGVIIRSDGMILTNAHVISGASGGGQITVKFSNGKTASATIVGSSSSHDIAVIKATGVTGLQVATLGDSGNMAVGDAVLAVGSPLGLEGSVTSGIVSALDRTIQESSSDQQQQSPFGGFGGDGQQQQSTQAAASIKNAIQTDAAINPGNSGGALVNSSGQVIGINTAIATTSSSSGSIGVGFAIPINDARQVAEQIIGKA